MIRPNPTFSACNNQGLGGIIIHIKKIMTANRHQVIVTCANNTTNHFWEINRIYPHKSNKGIAKQELALIYLP
jgi:hypothetical protein